MRSKANNRSHLVPGGLWYRENNKRERVLYHLKDGPKRGLVGEELLIVPR